VLKLILQCNRKLLWNQLFMILKTTLSFLRQTRTVMSMDLHSALVISKNKGSQFNLVCKHAQVNMTAFVDGNSFQSIKRWVLNKSLVEVIKSSIWLWTNSVSKYNNHLLMQQQLKLLMLNIFRTSINMKQCIFLKFGDATVPALTHGVNLMGGISKQPLLNANVLHQSNTMKLTNHLPT